MKRAIIILSLILFFQVISSKNLCANDFSGLYDFIEENLIYKKYKTRTDRFIDKKSNITPFVWFPAAGGKLLGAVPGVVVGGVVGGSIGVIVMPYFAATKSGYNYSDPLLGSLFGGAMLGLCTSFLGELVVGTPFYITQIIFYDLPKMAKNSWYDNARIKKNPNDEGRKDVPVVSPSQFKEPIILDTTVHEIKGLLPAPRKVGKEHPPGTSMNKTFHYSPPGPANNTQPKTESEKSE